MTSPIVSSSSGTCRRLAKVRTYLGRVQFWTHYSGAIVGLRILWCIWIDIGGGAGLVVPQIGEGWKLEGRAIS